MGRRPFKATIYTFSWMDCLYSGGSQCNWFFGGGPPLFCILQFSPDPENYSLLRLRFPGLYVPVVWWLSINVLGEPAASIFRVFEYGGSSYRINLCSYVPSFKCFILFVFLWIEVLWTLTTCRFLIRLMLLAYLPHPST
jgi:hypothetical protein